MLEALTTKNLKPSLPPIIQPISTANTEQLIGSLIFCSFSLRNTYHRLDKRTDDDDIDIIIIFILIKSIVVLLAIVVGSISAIFDHKVVLQIANQSVHHPRKTQAVAVATGVSIRRVLVDWYSTCRNISLNFSVYTVLKTKYHGTSSPISDEYIRFLLHYKFSCKHYVHKLSTIFN